MAEPITWRNLANPDFGDASRGLYFAGQSIKGAFDGLRDSLKGVVDQRNAIEDANWKTGKEANTNAFLNRLQQFQTPEEAQAAIKAGDLNAMLDGYGAQVDGVAARTAQAALVENLQRKALANQQYVDQQQEVTQRPVVAALAGAMQTSTNPEEIKNLQTAIQIYRDQGYLAPKTSIELFDKNIAREQGLIKQGRDDLTFAENQATWARAAEMFPVEKQLKQAQITSARESALTSQHSRQQDAIRTAIAQGKAATERIQAEADLAKNMAHATEILKKENPYNLTIGNYSGKAPLSEHVAKETGINEDLAKTLVADLRANPIKINGVEQNVPVHLLTAAASKFKDGWNLPNFTDAGRTADIRAQLTKLMQSSDHATKIAQASVDWHNATKPASQAAPGASTDFLKPGAVGKPPVVQKDGGLVYEDSKTVNFSFDSGVMANRADLPSGKLRVTVPDGDTIHIAGDKGKPMAIRLNGVDAQETAKNGSKGQAMSESAKAFLQDILSKGQVEIRQVSNNTDKYQRKVAEVFVDGKNVNDLLIEKGLGTSFNIGENPASKARREKMQKNAAATGVGMYGSGMFTSTDPVTGGLYRSMEAFGK